VDPNAEVTTYEVSKGPGGVEFITDASGNIQ
jgi:hypothetical protein